MNIIPCVNISVSTTAAGVIPEDGLEDGSCSYSYIRLGFYALSATMAI